MVFFGVWQIVDEVGIIGKGTPAGDYLIDKHRLWETVERDTILLYDWPVHMSQKTWMTKAMFNDLFDAMVFAQNYFIKEKPKTKDVSWEQTILYANKNLKDR